MQAGEEKVQGDIINVYKYLLGQGCKDDGAIISLWYPVTGQDGHRQLYKKFCLNVRKKNTVRVIKYWNGLLRQAVKSPFLLT